MSGQPEEDREQRWLRSTSESSRIARGITLLTTNVMKLAGLAVGVNELLLRPTLRPSAVALAAFMMAGAQLSEQAVLRVLDRLMGPGEAEHKHERP